MSCIIYDMIGWIEDNWGKVFAGLWIFVWMILPILLYGWIVLS